MPEIISKLKVIKPAYDFVYKTIMFVCKLLLIADITIITMSVIGRYVPYIPAPAWEEEVVLMFMAYMTVLSAALALRDGTHIRVTAFDHYLPKKLLNILNFISDLCVLILAVAMVIFGLKYAMQLGVKGRYVSLPWLSKFWQYFPVPLAGFAMIVFELEAIVKDIAAFYQVEEAKEEV